MYRRALAVALLLAGCPKPEGAPPPVALDDAAVARYLQAYRGLRALGPGLAERYRGPNPPGADQAGADFARIEAAVRAAGFAGYPEFVATSARIGWALSQAEGQGAVVDSDARQREGEAQLEQAIADPATPEVVRADLAANLERMRADYARNRRIAGATLTATGLLTDKQAVEVVLRHKAELEAAFQGR